MRWITPLFLALVLIEIADLVFAVDSVPAIFAITTDPYIVYTSNIFAILGLRALYFALAAVMHRFHYLKYALAILLVFIGSKIFIADAFGLGKVPGQLVARASPSPSSRRAWSGHFGAAARRVRFDPDQPPTTRAPVKSRPSRQRVHP